ncbi:tRNA (guanosine(18)-2'-O)-methyltransferase [Spirochaetota bacterium]|nr:tRNA (guanosine(18)-2'-O)-methyltransferase [Spirochaetota bacterium]
MKILLYGIRSFGNLAMIVRSVEHFGYKECYVYNDRESERECVRSDLAAYPKGLQRRLIRVSGGAMARVRIEVIEDYEVFCKNYKGRLIATSVCAGARRLDEVRFRANDCVIFGTEAWGLPRRVVTASDEAVMIPMLGMTQSLNLAVAVSIVLYEGFRQKSGN